MQQKYCDHGRSVALLKITWPILRARNSCGSGGSPRNASIFPSANNSIGLGEELVTHRISFAGSSPTWEALPARNMYWLEGTGSTPTVRPLRAASTQVP